MVATVFGGLGEGEDSRHNPITLCRWNGCVAVSTIIAVA
jgi:hypothetical protein